MELEAVHVGKLLHAICVMCKSHVDEVEHIAVDDEGNVIVMCSHCFNKAKLFFKRRTTKDV